MTRIVVIDNRARYFGNEGILSFFFLCHGHGPVIKLSLRYPRKKDRKNGMRLFQAVVDFLQRQLLRIFHSSEHR